MTLTTGISISGKMSVGMRRVSITISIDMMTKSVRAAAGELDDPYGGLRALVYDTKNTGGKDRRR